MNEYMRVKDVAAKLDVSVKTVGNLIRSGELGSHRIGGQWRIPSVALAEMLNRTKVKAGIESTTLN
jgi:excisionase family DNA binding protein